MTGPAKAPAHTGGQTQTSSIPLAALAWSVIPLDGCSTKHTAFEWTTNAVTGEVTERTHGYIEVGTGLNYLDEANQWTASQDLVELTADGGAAALHGQTKAYFKANLNRADAVTLVTASKAVYTARPLGLFWYDAASGKAALLAPLQDCVAELVPPNTVVYKGAFGPLADVRMVYTMAAIESDLVLLQQPKLPEGWNPATTRLELWHEWTGAPTPKQTPRVLHRQTDAALRAQMMEPDFSDHILDFGELWFPTGAAFPCDAADAVAVNTAAQVRVHNFAEEPAPLPVGKTWLEAGKRKLLIESVQWADVQPRLQRLSPSEPVGKPGDRLDRQVCLSRLAPPCKTSKPGEAISLARSAYRPSGFVLDYIAVTGGNWNYTFETYDPGLQNTYYIGRQANGYFGGLVTFQAGCVIKFFPDSWLITYGSVLCQGSSSTPSILTSRDDDAFGEILYDVNPLYSSTHCPTYAAAQALWDYYTANGKVFHGMKIRWAKLAVQLDSPSGNGAVYDSSVEFCQKGFQGSYGGTVSANVCSVINVGCSSPPPGGGGGTESLSKGGIGSSVVTSGYGTPLTCYITDVCTGDTEPDGLPDVWEYQYFGGTYVQPDGNDDGDGLTNLQEYQIGSNPAAAFADTAVEQTVMTGVGQQVTFTMCGSSQCSGPLEFVVHGGPSHGQLTGTGATRTYTPSPSFVETDELTFTAGDSGYQTVFIDVVSAPPLTTFCYDDCIVLRWSVPQWLVGRGSVDGYKIYRREGSNPTETDLLATVNSPALHSYVDAAVLSGRTYCYRVKFFHVDECNGAVIYESPFSNTSCNEICPPPCAVHRPGFTSFSLYDNDDHSVGPVSLPFALNYFGNSYTELYVNNNGNVTLDGGLEAYTPYPLAIVGREILAPFWADVDTRNTESDVVHYGVGTVGGRSAFGVNWVNVGYFAEKCDKLLVAQLVLVDRSDIANGDFDMEFNYCHIGWEAGDVSGGDGGGMWVGPEPGPARAGFASFQGEYYFEFAGSGGADALLDSNFSTGLIHSSYNSPDSGRYVFQFRSGAPMGTP